MRMMLIVVALLFVAEVALEAQQRRPARPATVRRAEPKLIFEREVYEYPGRARRDPFQPLTGRTAGPLFSDLKLHVIIYVDSNPSESVVTLTDAGQNQYRVRRGETVGNATVMDISRERVVFSVDDFGLRRQEVLDMKANQGVIR